jgi:hypothetical protein
MYYTTDWESARESVRALASLQPQLLVTGHGQPLEGQEMREGLRRLADDFDSIAIPKHGVYLEKPAKPEDGSAYWKP